MALLDNLISYWKLNETGGTRKDVAGGHDLTDNNTVGAAAGVIDNGADFEESNGDECLSVADHADFDFSTAMSWSLWVKPESLVPASHCLISKFIDGSQASYRLRTDGDGNLNCLLPDALTDNDDSSSPNGSVAGVLSAGVLTHIVVVYDGTQSTNADKLKIYLDGVQQTLSFVNGNIPSSLQNGSADLVFGMATVGGSAEFDGILDEMGCWNRPLTQDEVDDLYNSGAGLTYPFIPITNTHALDFERSSAQYVYHTDDALLSITGDLTIGSHIKLEDTSLLPHVLVSKWDEATNKRSYSFYIGSDGKLHLVLSANGTDVVDLASNYSHFGQENVKYHVEVTYKASTGVGKFYINGVLDAVVSGFPTSIHDNTSNFAIGANDTLGTPANFVDGIVDEVRLFASERTAAQVLEDMHTENANGAVGFWRFNNNYNDSSGNGLNLTAVGSPVFTTDVPFFTSGQTLEAIATESVYLSSNEPTVNKDGEGIFVGEHNAGVETMRGLVKFDISSIPTNAVINSVFLILTFDGDGSDNARVFNVFRLKRAWVENQATWNVYSTGNSWETAGASGAADRESTKINDYHAQVAAPDTTTPAKKSVILNRRAIQELINGGFTNNGFILTVDNESNDAILYASDDNADSAKRPKLLIDYTSPVLAQTKELKYTVKDQNAITKNLAYALLTSASLTKSLRYIITGQVQAVNITKSLNYEVLTQPGITKSLRFALLNVVPVSKSLRYTVIASIWAKGNKTAPLWTTPDKIPNE